MADDKKLWTQSRGRAWRRCRRLHYLKYEEGWRLIKDDENLHTGTIFHQGLEAWWGDHATPEDRLKAALEAVAGKEREPDAQVRMEEMIRAYHDRWIDDHDRFEVVHIESEFRVPLFNPETAQPSRTWDLGGKLDVMVKEKATGYLWILEHKTTGETLSGDSSYFPKRMMDPQTNQYYCGALGLDFDPHGVIYDVIQKTRIRPMTINSNAKRREPYVEPEEEWAARNAARPPLARKKSETDEAYAVRCAARTPLQRKERPGETDEEWAARCPRPETMDEYRERVRQWYRDNRETALQRRMLVRTEEALLEFLRDAWQDAKTAHEAARIGSHPRNPDACQDYRRTCEFFEHCAFGVPLESIPMIAKHENVHPELSEVE